MKKKIFSIIKTKPAFLYLLPVFFVLHGYRENYDFVPVADALLLTVLYLASSLIISFIFWLLYRNFFKANLMAFLIMAFHLFFGSMHDGLKQLLPGSFFTRYTFILPVSFLFFIVIIILLKKRKRPLLRTSYYLNVLLLLILLADAGWLAKKIVSYKRAVTSLPKGFTSCDTCHKPDIYFLLMDEYAGNTELKDIFHFDNTPFENDLALRSFHMIPNSHSNYNFTPFSIASTLNMDYLDMQKKDPGKPDLTYCYELIKTNPALQFLELNHYQFYNYSVFDFEGQPARTSESFLAAKTRLITSQTFLSRIERDIRFNLLTKLKLRNELRRDTYVNLHNNTAFYKLTWDIAGKKIPSPKLIYTHLMMPHFPFYYDKDGKELPFEKLLKHNEDDYIGYLQYTNKKILELIDHILSSSPSPPVIILLGDHGARFSSPVEKKYYFMNLSSIYLPGKNYSSFNDSLTNVNFFRAFFNTEFGQQLPYLKDSTIFLKD